MLKKSLVEIINFYQLWLSFDTGLLRVLAPGGACRYPVSCSQYTKEAIIEFGVVKGSWLGVRRIISCR